MNRGQVIRFHFLNAAQTQDQPSIWLDVIHPGVKLKFHLPGNQILSVPQPIAASIGALTGIVVLGLIVWFAKTVWVGAVAAFVYGLFAQIPGACLVRLWRKIRDWLGG